MRLLLTAFAAAALCATLPTTAQAARPIDWMPKFERAAIGYWGHGTPPACGVPRFSWVENLGTADADAGQCLIQFNVYKWHRMPDPGMRCVLVFHEMGHEYGQQHSERGIMAAAPPVVGWESFKPCARLVKRSDSR